MALVATGTNDCEIARRTGIPRCTIRDWRQGQTAQRRVDASSACLTCGHPQHDFAALPASTYAYVLGMYLGDGHISRNARTWRLRISLDMNWPGIMVECEHALQTLLPNNRVSFVHENQESCCMVVSVHSKQLVWLSSSMVPA